MPHYSRKSSVFVPTPIEQIQLEMIPLRTSVQRADRRIERLLLSIKLPENAKDIWNGTAPPTLETEIDGVLGVIRQDYIDEISDMLYRAAVATPETVAEGWEPPEDVKTQTCSHPDCPRARSLS